SCRLECSQRLAHPRTSWSFSLHGRSVKIRALTTRNRQFGPGKASEEEVRMKGLIAAAGLCTRLQDLSEKRNKVLLDLGGETLLGNILHHFSTSGITESYVVVGFDAAAVRARYGTQATCVLNPFYEQHGILGSMW